jgi:uncharacterized protein (DUF1778 family)
MSVQHHMPRLAPKDHMLQVRIPKRLLERIRSAAAKQEQDVSEFARLAMLRAAEQVEKAA